MEEAKLSHDDQMLHISLSELTISQPETFNSLPSDLNRSRLIKELSFRLNQLNSWRLELQSSSYSLLNSIDEKIAIYKTLLSLKSFNNVSIQLLRRISNTMLCLIRPATQSANYKIVECQRFEDTKYNLSVLANAYSIIIESFNSIITDIKLLSDNQTLIACSYDSTIRIWNINTGKQLKILVGHKNYIEKIFVSQDEKYLLSASHDMKVIIWDLSKYCKIYEFASHLKPVYDAIITKDQEFIASGDESGCIYVGYWRKFVEKLENRKFLDIDWYVRFEHGSKVRCLESTADGKLLFSGGQIQIKVFDIEKKELKSIFSGHSQIILSMKFLDTENYLISTGQDTKVNIWDVEKLCLIASVKTRHSDYISSICVSHDKNSLYLVGRDPSYSVLNIKNHNEYKHFPLDKGFNNALILKNANEIIICGDHLSVVNLETKQSVFKIHSNFFDNLTILKANHYLKYFFGYFKDGTIKFWSFDSGEVVHVSKLIPNLRSISHTPNFKYLVYISTDNLIIVQNCLFDIHE